MVVHEVLIPDDVDDIPRVGVRLRLGPGVRTVEWLGAGPHEGYSDRHASTRFGRWTTPVDGWSVPYVHPQASGNRTGVNCQRLADRIAGPAYVLDGGLDAWKKAGLPTRIDAKAPLELMRQVQIAAGSLILLGVVLGYAVGSAFFLLSGFVGAGLILAGVTGFCGMARLLDKMPWNRRTH